MSHGKETPRQKMIGMMYLVLTALLALNVSKDVLNAFVLVDDKMSETIKNFGKKNKVVYDEFDKQYTMNKTKVEKFYNLANEVRKEADEIYEYIQEKKIEIVEASEGPDEKTEALEGHHIHGAAIGGKDNADIPAQIMIGDNNDKAGRDLKLKIEAFREFVTGIVNDELKVTIEQTLNTDDQEGHGHGELKQPWEKYHFEHLPLIGVLTIMTGVQADIRNVESDVINYLLTQIDAGSFKFNKLEPVVIPNSSYIIKGNQYTAEVFLAAFDTTQQPKVLIGKYEKYVENGIEKYRMMGKYDSLDIKSGRGIFSRAGSSVGNFSWGGLIKLRKSDGSYIEKPFDQSYQVAEGSVVVSPTKMNVFYTGVDNPVEISIAGIPADKIFPQITNADIKKVRGGEYTVNPKRLGNSILTVYAEIDGQRKKLGEKPFRVKKVPNPVAKVGQKTGGPIAKNILYAQTGVVAELEDFVFDLEFKVTQFTVSATLRGFVRQEPSKSAAFTPEQKALIQSVDRNAKLYIEDIKAVGPDGQVRDLPPIPFLIQ